MRKALLNAFSGASELAARLDGAAIERLLHYAALLAEANKTMNLTALSTPEEMAVKHFLDCLYALPCLDMPGRIIDVGSGGGLPGLALACMRPERQITLLEATGKKCDFLRRTVEALSLPQVTVAQGRAEELARQPEHRGAYQLAFARAVAALPALCECCLPFLAIGGRFFAMKGPRAAEELAAAKGALFLLKAEYRQSIPYSLPDGSGERCILVIEKTGGTPAAYPRRPGLPVKQPLR